MRRKGFSPSLPLSGFAAMILVATLTSSFAFSQTEFVIHNFKSGDDGAEPNATLLADKAGNLYGTTTLGGGSASCGLRHGAPEGCGTVFEVTPPAAGGHWTEKILYAFAGPVDGLQPVGGLAFDEAGDLYGTTVTGGSGGAGTVFQLKPPASGGAWTFSVIHNLTFSNNGYAVYPVVDKLGDVYFEEPAGGSGLGAVSQLTPPAAEGGAWTYRQLYVFKGQPDGLLPIGTLNFDKAGNLYGITDGGGSANHGTVFELVRPATRSGTWTEKVLYAFQGIPDGAAPYSGVIIDTAGNLYGTTVDGGVNNPAFDGDGTVFELSPPSETGGAWTEAVLYSFQGATDGKLPYAPLVRDNDGNLFGTTITNTVFELSPPTEAGGSWTETTLFDFPSPAHDGGSEFFGGLTFHLPSRSTLYGATPAGGSADDGVIFGLVP